MITFYRLSKQSYGHTIMCQDSIRQPDKAKIELDEIIFGDYDRDGGCKWEFTIRQVNFNQSPSAFGGKDSAVRVQIFEDAVKALNSRKVKKALLALEGCLTLDDAESRLIASGIKSKTDK